MEQPKARLQRYLDDIELARRVFEEKVDSVLQTIKSLCDRRKKLDEELDDFIAKVNDLGRRRHNVISVSWEIDRRYLDTSLAQPRGPQWYKVVYGTKGSRHLNRIDRLTTSAIRASYQHRYADELMQLYRAIKQRTNERDLITARLVRVQKALRYVELQQHTRDNTKSGEISDE